MQIEVKALRHRKKPAGCLVRHEEEKSSVHHC